MAQLRYELVKLEIDLELILFMLNNEKEKLINKKSRDSNLI